MIIDCDTCAVRGPGCADCVVSVLLGGPPEEVTATVDGRPVELDATERWAVHNLAVAGLVPPLRMVPVHPATPPGGNRPSASPRRAHDRDRTAQSRDSVTVRRRSAG